MTKSDLIDALAADTGLTKADADRFLKSFTSNVSIFLAFIRECLSLMALPISRTVSCSKISLRICDLKSF